VLLDLISKKGSAEEIGASDQELLQIEVD
jgi:hypothetical protein